MHFARGQVLGEIAINDLTVIAHAGIHGPDIPHSACHQAAFLGQLAVGRLFGGLPRLQLAGGQLPKLLPHGIAKLADHVNFVFRGQRRNAGPAVVMQHLALAGFAVFQKNFIHRNRKHTPGEHGVFRKLFLKMRHMCKSFP